MNNKKSLIMIIFEKVNSTTDLFVNQCTVIIIVELDRNKNLNQTWSDFKYPTDYRFHKVSDSIGFGFGIGHINNKMQYLPLVFVKSTCQIYSCDCLRLFSADAWSRHSENSWCLTNTAAMQSTNINYPFLQTITEVPIKNQHIWKQWNVARQSINLW